MTAVTFAVPHESADLRKAVQSPDVIIAHTGIGIAAAEKCVRALIAQNRPQMLISSGYAGALDPAIAHGELFVAANFTSPELLTHTKARRGILTTQLTAAETPAQKAILARETGAQAVDMETSAIAAICATHRIPLLSLRAISDAATADIPVPLHISYDLQKQRPRILALLVFLATHPARIGPFSRFVRGLSPARAAVTAEILAVLKKTGHR